MRGIYLVSAFLLAGCAHPAAFTWEHPGLDSATAERQGEIDSAECTALAMQQVVLPGEPAQTNVNVNVSGPGGGIYAGGHMTMTGSEMQADRMRNDAFEQAEQERASLANACLLQRGWVRVKREDDQRHG